jgi:DNA polymerase I-like protein with 3'-5' exonuclease and polymerase domains
MAKGTAGIEMEGSRDLMLAEYCLMAGIQWDGFGLAAMTKKYLGKDRDKSLQKSFIGHTGDFSESQLVYAVEDTSDLFPLGKIMQEEMKSAGVDRAWGIENRSIPAWGDMQFYGQKIDTTAWQGIMAYNQERMVEERLNLDKYFEPFYDVDLFGKLDINYNSQPTILYGLQRMGVKIDGEKIRNTNKETQKKIRNLPVIEALEKYRSAVKAYGTYGQTYLDAIHAITGRIHPRFNQYGTDTGRPSCRENLNVLNIPRDKRFRNAFITDWDRLISTVDFSGAELRILADQSGDPLMVKGFNSGTDFHCYVASMLFGVEVTKKNENARLRQPAKTINFG